MEALESHKVEDRSESHNNEHSSSPSEEGQNQTILYYTPLKVQICFIV
jgi:hypothetical protein